MPRLKKSHKELIVKELACYTPSKEVQQKLRDEYGIEVSASQIAFYNPDNNSSKNLSEVWREQFRHIRNQYKDEVAKHDISAKGYRLGMLQKMFERQYVRGNDVLAAELLERAAKELGGAYEGKDPDTGDGVTINNYIQQVYNKIEGRESG
ncbi:MAG: DUF2280 domain-containing protein [Balneolaceae bacterium]